LATAVTPKPKKRTRFLWLAATIAGVLAVAAGVLFYFRPLLVVSGLQRVAEWKLGLAEHDVRLGQYRIRYLAGGSGKPLVLVHGLAGRAEDWLALVPELRDAGYRIYALDLLGYGRSDKPDVDYSIALESDILRQFIDSQHLQQPDLAGWSMGGWIAGKFAVDNPGRVHRLILLDSAGMKFDAVNAAALRPKTEADLAHMMHVLTPHPMRVPSFYAHDFLRHFAEEDWIVGRALKSMYTGKDLLDGKLGGVKIPVLLVWGKEDVLTPPSIGEQMRQEMPQSILYLVNGCGHLAPVECSKPIAAEMVKFLRADPPLAPGERTIASKMTLTP
jgi:pimeloyl-ACP methyl ester carboxylesterase